jgi:hypothetical protein
MLMKYQVYIKRGEYVDQVSNYSLLTEEYHGAR